MWLINATTLRLEQVVDEQQCRFVILSHTWMPRGEVSFQDMGDIKHVASRKPGFEKIRKTCEFARCHRFRYAWIDTCCIDKTSSAELSEAINSMFRWYQKAAICYVFLSDFEPLHIEDFNLDFLITQETLVEDKLRGCRWFTRGWTLQELIAPRYMNFFDKEWNFVGTKSGLSGPLHRITNIDESVLRDSSILHTIPVASRMSWAAGRETTRIEDMAYCLLGIFDINMPMLYGEGQKAFMRLQQRIASENADLSLFAWQCAEQREYSGLFADSPKDFAHCSKLITYHAQFSTNEIAITNIGMDGDLIEEAWADVCEMEAVKVELSPDEQDWSVPETASPIYVVPRLLPADVQRLSAMGDITIVLRHDKNLSALLASSEGHPAAAYFPAGLPV
ncbi:hypothetical protein VPNG_05954 [Cytospora leucostoma]|uniref:Heterokaryon incompatibility domain-containing protein n=1 Tax=Cytospora leucostoma TaxID=1230097 RepID=A0A423XAV8_9PEZI|nr:hypothetical protein VPNG_05954 [Cytospora leucostoma]